MAELWRRLAALWRGGAGDDEVAEELRFHREMRARDTGDAAAAQRAVGSELAWRERAHDAWGWRWLDEFRLDSRCAIRSLQRSPGFTTVAVATLALAIGLNVIVYAVADAVLVRGFPLVERNDRLIAIQEIVPSGIGGFSYADYLDWRAGVHAFQDIAAVASGAPRVRFGERGGRPADLLTFRVTANTFGLLGVPPMLGRDFGPDDERSGAAAVAILNYRLWETRFGKRADVVGSTVVIDGAPATIVGVMPERFEFPHRADLWMPVIQTPQLLQRGSHGGYLAFGRLRPGATFEEARAGLETVNARLQTSFPATNRDRRLRIVDNAHFHAGPNGPIVYGSLWVGACFILLIACANVANLTLVRTIGRWREFSTRMALGAGTVRMTRQILLEGAAIASLAGALGWWIAKWGVRTWAAATASPFQVRDYRVDAGTLAYLVAISALAAIVFSLPPIARVVRLRATGTLRADGRGVTQSLRARRMATALVGGQMALAVVLVSGAGVLVRSLINVVDADTGVRDPDHLLVGLVRLPAERFAAPPLRVAYVDRLVSVLARVPGVDDVSVSNSIPLRGGRTQAFEVEGRPPLPDGRDLFTQVVTAGAGYFRVVGSHPVAGRAFDDGDRLDTQPVAIVNQSMADVCWPGEPAVGKRLRVFDGSQAGDWRTVVGVVSNIMEGDPVRQQFKPVVYLPLGQAPPPVVHFLARTLVPPNGVARAVRTAVDAIDPDAAVDDLTTFDTIVAFDGDYTDLQHMELGRNAGVAPIFAIVALLLAAIGLYAVIAHSVSQRTQEIGVRMAIGAGARDIRRLVFRGGMAPVAPGVACGLAGSLAVNRVLQSQLVGVSPYDPITIAATLTVLLLIALCACYIPARRAMRVDPVLALRHE